MSDLQKTTVYLEESSYRQLKRIARREGRKPAQLVREAVAEYAARRSKPVRPRVLGAGKSGRGDLAEHSEELLAGMARRS